MQSNIDKIREMFIDGNKVNRRKINFTVDGDGLIRKSAQQGDAPEPATNAQSASPQSYPPAR
ncbi:hypothetical protein LBMAG53_21970 [Planctomycetota bacterium]|nr:hypothetical protein LBMAG53_21970 [Planctomycetota bacterium]